MRRYLQRIYPLRVNIQTIQRINATNIRKTNNSTRKWAEDLNRHFFQRRHTDGQQTHEERLNIIKSQANACHNHSEMSLHTCHNGCHQKENIKCWRRCGEKEIFVHCWCDCRLVQPLWKRVWSFLKKLKIELTHDPAISLLGIYLEKNII